MTAAAIARAAVDWEGIRAPLVLECSTEPDGPAVCAALRLTPDLAVTSGAGCFRSAAIRALAVLVAASCHGFRTRGCQSRP